MIKIDHNYTDYRDDTDPKYPGGKAVNATTTESTDGTPLLADWMNDVNGALQAIFLEAFGDIDKVSGKPDNVQESDVLKAIKEIIKKLLLENAFQYRGVVSKVDLDKIIDPGSYKVASNGYAGALLVFATHSSTGVVQFYKDGYRDEPWMCRNAIDDDPRCWTEWRFLGVQLTTNVPNSAECQRDSPWAASPHWVYNLLTGNASEGVNNAVATAIKKLVSGGVKHIDFSNETGFIEWDNGFKIAAVSFSVGADWTDEAGGRFSFPITFKQKPLYLTSSVSFDIKGCRYFGLGAFLYFSLDLTGFMVISSNVEALQGSTGCLWVVGI